MNRLRLVNIGQLRVADLEFGDLTVFVGPQATGKSIALQFLKLVEDSGPINATGRIWRGLGQASGTVL